MRQAEIYYGDSLAGILAEGDSGYTFVYHVDYLNNSQAKPVSLTFPLQPEAFHRPQLFPFFDGLIPEGWLLSVTEKNWKINNRDRMGLLMVCCKDCIGAVTVHPLLEIDS
jgi:serine/threonine-protein kinase HipA